MTPEVRDELRADMERALARDRARLARISDPEHRAIIEETMALCERMLRLIAREDIERAERLAQIQQAGHEDDAPAVERLVSVRGRPGHSHFVTRLEEGGT